MVTTSTSDHSYQMFLSFINAILGENYDTYASQDVDDDSILAAADVFQGVNIGIDSDTNDTIPTLSSVAQNLSRIEGKVIDEK